MTNEHKSILNFLDNEQTQKISNMQKIINMLSNDQIILNSNCTIKDVQIIRDNTGTSNISFNELLFCINESKRNKHLKKIENLNTDLYVTICHSLHEKGIHKHLLTGYDITFFSLCQKMSLSNFSLQKCLDLIQENDSNSDYSLHEPKAILIEFINQLKIEFEGLTCTQLDCFDVDLINDLSFTITKFLTALEELFRD